MLVGFGAGFLVALLLGFAWGYRDAFTRWAALGTGRPRIQKHRDAAYWVCDAGDPRACNELLEILERQRDKRERDESVERMRRRL